MAVVVNSNARRNIKRGDLMAKMTIKVSCTVSKTYEINGSPTHDFLNNILADFQDCPVGCLAEDDFKKEIINK